MKMQKRIMAFVIGACLACLPAFPAMAEETDFGTNYALNKTVSGSHTNEFLQEHNPLTNLTDGKNQPMVDIPAGLTFEDQYEYFQVDLGADVTISHIRLVHRDDTNFLPHRPNDFAVDIWNGSAWVRVVEKHNLVQGSETSIQDYYFEPVTGSCIRITGNCARGKNELFTMLEVEAYADRGTAEQMAKSKDALDNERYGIPEMTGTPSEPMEMPKRVDVDENDVCLNKATLSSTRWEVEGKLISNLTSGSYKDQAVVAELGSASDNEIGWFQVNLGGDYTINKISYSTLSDGFPIDVAVDVWSSGKWVRVGQRFDLTQGKQEFYFDDIACNRIRISAKNVAKDPNGDSYYKLTEIEAYLVDGVTDAQKAQAVQESPDAERELPTPDPINSCMDKVGARDNADLISPLNEDGLEPMKSDAELEEERNRTPVPPAADANTIKIHMPFLIAALSMMGVALVGAVIGLVLFINKRKKMAV